MAVAEAVYLPAENEPDELSDVRHAQETISIDADYHSFPLEGEDFEQSDQEITEEVLSARGISKVLSTNPAVIRKAIVALGDELGPVNEHKFEKKYTAGYTTEQQSIIKKYLEFKGLFVELAPEDVLPLYGMAKVIGSDPKTIKKAIAALGDQLGPVARYKYQKRHTEGYTPEQQSIIRQHLAPNGTSKSRPPKESQRKKRHLHIGDAKPTTSSRKSPEVDLRQSSSARKALDRATGPYTTRELVEEHILDIYRSYNKKRQTKLLSREEEAGLAKRIEKGDDVARKEMIISNLGLVVSSAVKFANQGIAISDIVQEGILGLMHATSKFDHHRGTKFSTYASIWVRKYMIQAIIDQGRTIKITNPANCQLRQMKKEGRKIEQRTGRPATPEMLAEATDIDVGNVNHHLIREVPAISLDSPVNIENETPVGELIAGSDDTETTAIENDSRSRVAKEIRKVFDLTGLTENERNVLLLQAEETSGAEIAERLGLGLKQVYNIGATGRKKLRAHKPLLISLIS